jgi:hypothetical protein
LPYALRKDDGTKVEEKIRFHKLFGEVVISSRGTSPKVLARCRVMEKFNPI